MDKKYNKAISAETCENTSNELQKTFTRQDSLGELRVLDWRRVEQLQVRPRSKKSCESDSECAVKTEEGCYVNEDKTCVLLVGATEEQIQDSMMLCGTTLQVLDMDGTIVSELHLSHLMKLRSLRLSGCGGLVELPGLSLLTQLTHLNLSGCSGLTALPGLGQLTQLTHLNLSGCSGLTELPELGMLTQLTHLNLSRCSSLTSLPEGIRFMASLRRLDLRGMLLRELPDWLPEIAEKFSNEILPLRSGKKKAIVYLRNTTVESVDMSIFEQPYEVVLEWFHERKQGRTVALNEIKVVFLGDGEAGKSHIIARLMNDGGEPKDYMALSTPGIAINNRFFEIDGRQAKIHFWDFGGQEILHSMHRMFLTDRTVYVVVVNARDDTQNERAKYWFQNINSVAPSAPMLLVLNKIDQNPSASVDEMYLRKRYSGLRHVVRLSALTCGKEKFNQEFTERLLEEVQHTGYLDAVWPAPWMQIKNKLQNMDSDYISGDQYRRICEANQVVDYHHELLHWFNDLGVSFCYSESRRLKDYIVLRPEWITNAIYTLIFNPIRGNKNGIIPHEEIFRMLTKPENGTDIIRRVYTHMYYSDHEVEYVLGVMRNFQLSFQLDQDREMIPMLCDRNSSPLVYEYEEDEEAIEFRLVYDFLPSNVIHRLMVDMRHDLDYNNVWYTGARFVSLAAGSSAVVCSDGNYIRMIVRSEDNRRMAYRYLESIREAVQSINNVLGLQEQESLIAYKADGRTEYFDYGMLVTSMEYGETTVFSKHRRRRIPIQDILLQSDSEIRDVGESLLWNILKAYVKMQDNEIFWDAGEEMRNTYLRDALNNSGYIVQDQTRQGTSAFQREYIAMDLDIRLSAYKPFAAFDAFVSHDFMSFKRYSERYVQKMLNYAWNQQVLYLANYVKCQKHNFTQIVNKCMDHLRTEYGNVTSLAVKKLLPEYPYVAAVRCMFNQKGFPVEMYFVFVHIEG